MWKRLQKEELMYNLKEIRIVTSKEMRTLKRLIWTYVQRKLFEWGIKSLEVISLLSLENKSNPLIMYHTKEVKTNKIKVEVITHTKETTYK